MDSPNVLWITLDSLRADHSSIDGYRRDTTPRIATLGESGLAFPNCIAHSKSTLPSSGAILTGLAPTRTRLGIDGDVLPESVRTVAERFGEAGYATACLSRNSFVSGATDLDRGFDRFQWLSSSTIHEVGPTALAKYLLNIRRHSAGFTLDTAKHASPYLMNETAKRWLRAFESDDDPFFFYLHYNEPHRPYYPPLSYLDEYAADIEMSPREAASFALDVHYDLDEIVANGCGFTDREWDALVAMYDAEIAYTDEMVGRLVSYVEGLDLDETIVVVTADHGELFGEYGLLAHSYALVDAVTRVPLVIARSGDRAPVEAAFAVQDTDLVQHADVMTTLLESAGADTAGTIGVDLRETGREYAVSQRGPADFDHLKALNPSFDDTKFHQATMTALRTEAYRYQVSDDRDSLLAIGDEEVDVVDDHPSLVEEYAESAEDWLEEHGRPIDSGRRAEYSEAVERQLRDLGYRH
jgi:uncharacterized sulfatase